MEEIKIQKKTVDNSNYRERFQFQLKVNENIICQRYFRIIPFDYNSLNSKELFDVLDSCVSLIKDDLVSKSRVYLWNTADSQMKLTGYAKDDNGNAVNEEQYIDIPQKEWDEDEFINPWDSTFKFLFIVDDNVVYSNSWDGSVYPKFVRNSVDITNSKSPYVMVQIMNSDRKDLVIDIIKNICDVCSNSTNKNYTKSDYYCNDVTFDKASNNKNNDIRVWDYTNILSNKTDIYKSENEYTNKYRFSSRSVDYINGWREYCIKKYGTVKHDKYGYLIM